MHPGRAPNAKARNSDISISAGDRGPRPICIMGSRKPRLVQKRKGKREWASAVSRGPGEETLDRKSVSARHQGARHLMMIIGGILIAVAILTGVYVATNWAPELTVEES